MQAILSFASTTFRESIRSHLILGVLFLALGFLVSALLLAELALDERIRVILDWGLFCVSMFSVMLAILTGVSTVHKEIGRKTLYVILSRPIPRWYYILGKYLGLIYILVVTVGSLGFCFLLLLAIENVSPTLLLFQTFLIFTGRIRPSNSYRIWIR